MIFAMVPALLGIGELTPALIFPRTHKGGWRVNNELNRPRIAGQGESKANLDLAVGLTPWTIAGFRP
jgi:hypothetical protein